MKKKPALQYILDNFNNYDVAQLKKVKQPKWIRDILIDFKKNGYEGIPSYKSPAEIAELMTLQSKPKNKSHSYRILRYIGPTTYIGKDEIINNELLLEIDRKEIKAGFAVIDIDKFPANSLHFVRDIDSIIEFNTAVQDEAWKIHYPTEEKVQNILSSNKIEEGSGKFFKIRRID